MTKDEAGLTVAQMSVVTGVSAHTLRYYERAGLIRPVARTSGGRRRYSPADVDWVAFLLRLRETGMPIHQMRAYADLRHRGSVTLVERLRLLQTHQKALRDQIARLRLHDKALADKIATYQRHIGETHTHHQNGTDHD